MRRPRRLSFTASGIGRVDIRDVWLLLTVRSAELVDGMTVMDLGCGWGSLSLWLLSAYPNMRVTAVSNSSTQARRARDERHDNGSHCALCCRSCLLKAKRQR